MNQATIRETKLAYLAGFIDTASLLSLSARTIRLSVRVRPHLVASMARLIADLGFKGVVEGEDSFQRVHFLGREVGRVLAQTAGYLMGQRARAYVSIGCRWWGTMQKRGIRLMPEQASLRRKLTIELKRMHKSRAS